MVQWPSQEESGHKVVTLWKETRALTAGWPAEVEAYVVLPAGVGWVDFIWRRQGGIWPENRRLVCDWTGQSRAAAVRQVVDLADGWFAYCLQQSP